MRKNAKALLKEKENGVSIVPKKGVIPTGLPAKSGEKGAVMKGIGSSSGINGQLSKTTTCGFLSNGKSPNVSTSDVNDPSSSINQGGGYEGNQHSSRDEESSSIMNSDNLGGDYIRRQLLEKKLDELTREFEKINIVTAEKERELYAAHDAYKMLDAKYRAEVTQYNSLLCERNEKLQEANERISQLEAAVDSQSGNGIDKLKFDEMIRLNEMQTDEIKRLRQINATLQNERLDWQGKAKEQMRIIEESMERERQVRDVLGQMQAQVEVLRHEKLDLERQNSVLQGTSIDLSNKLERMEGQMHELEKRCANAFADSHEIEMETAAATDGKRKDLEMINNLLIEENINLKLTIAEQRKEMERLRQQAAARNGNLQTPNSVLYDGETPSRSLNKRYEHGGSEDTEYYKAIITDLEQKIVCLLDQNDKLNVLLHNATE
jgi:chromosome segregation ATPase